MSEQEAQNWNVDYFSLHRCCLHYWVFPTKCCFLSDCHQLQILLALLIFFHWRLQKWWLQKHSVQSWPWFSVCVFQLAELYRLPDCFISKPREERRNESEASGALSSPSGDGSPSVWEAALLITYVSIAVSPQLLETSADSASNSWSEFPIRRCLCDLLPAPNCSFQGTYTTGRVHSAPPTLPVTFHAGTPQFQLSGILFLSHHLLPPTFWLGGIYSQSHGWYSHNSMVVPPYIKPKVAASLWLAPHFL